MFQRCRGLYAQGTGRLSPKRGVIGLALIFGAAAASLPLADKAHPASFSSDGIDIVHLKITRFKSRIFHLQSRFATAVVGSPEIADVLPMSDREIYIQAKKVGSTNVSLFAADKHLIGVVDIEVTIDAKAVADRIRANVGGSKIRVSASQEQVILGGEVRNAIEAEHAVEIAKSLTPDIPIINLMEVAASPSKSC